MAQNMKPPRRPWLCSQQESNLHHELRRPVLDPLSYGSLSASIYFCYYMSRLTGKAETMDMKEFYESLAGLVRAGWRAKIDDRGWIQLRAPCDQEFSYTPMIAVCLRATKQCFDKSRDRKEVD